MFSLILCYFKMKYIFIILFLTFFHAKGVANQSGKMETINTQKHGNIMLNLLRTQTGKMYTWYTVLTNANNNKQLVIDSDLIEYEEKLYNIIFSYLNDKDLYVFYDKFGSVMMIHYHFTAGYTFDKKVTPISQYLCGSSFGSQSNIFRYVKLNNKIYIYLSSGQHFSNKQESFYTLDLTTSQLRKMIFSGNTKVVVAVYVENKTYFDNIAYRLLTQERINQINETKKFLEKPYYLYEISSEKEQQEKELEEILSVRSLEKYPTFEKTREEVEKEEEKGLDSSWNRNLKKSKEHKRAEKLMKEILEFTGNKMAGKYKIHDFLYEGYNNYPEYIKMYYFFCTDEHNQVQIIRYDMYENLWYIGSFEEIEFEPQIDIYKSPDSEI